MATKHPPLPPHASRSDEEIKEYYERVHKYVTTMATVKVMYRKGILDLDDYGKCEKLIADKYGIPDNSIHRSSNPDE